MAMQVTELAADEGDTNAREEAARLASELEEMSAEASTLAGLVHELRIENTHLQERLTASDSGGGGEAEEGPLTSRPRLLERQKNEWIGEEGENV